MLSYGVCVRRLLGGGNRVLTGVILFDRPSEKHAQVIKIVLHRDRLHSVLRESPGFVAINVGRTNHADDPFTEEELGARHADGNTLGRIRMLAILDITKLQKFWNDIIERSRRQRCNPPTALQYRLPVTRFHLFGFFPVSFGSRQTGAHLNRLSFYSETVFPSFVLDS